MTSQTNDFDYINAKILATVDQPVFTLADWGKGSKDFMGGYYYSTVTYGQQLAEIAIRLLDGAEPGDIPLNDAGEGFGAHLNRSLVLKYKLDRRFWATRWLISVIPVLFGKRTKVYWWER